jgi:hypothetical protein
MTEIMGIGSYVGETREGPGGQLYEWVEGVDGLGNPVGFWRGIKRAFKRAAGFVRPLARAALPYTKFIPGAGTAIYAGGTMAQRAGLLGVGEFAEPPKGRVYIGPPSQVKEEFILVQDAIRQGNNDENSLTNLVFHKRHPSLKGTSLPPLRNANSGQRRLIREWGRIRNGIVRPSLTIEQLKKQMDKSLPSSGVQGFGEIAEGPDGQLYEWVEGVDGLGNPIGFWKKLKQAAGGLLRKALPAAGGLIPGAGSLMKFLPGGGGLPGIVGGLIRNIPGIDRVTRLTRGFCNALPQLEPCIQQIPGAQRPYQIGTQVCGALKKVGLAGVGDEVMEGPDGQLYEVVEGIGEFGEARRVLRPIWLSIPAVVRPRGRRRVVKQVVPGQPAIRAAAAAAAPAAAAPTAGRAAPVRRFR